MEATSEKEVEIERWLEIDRNERNINASQNMCWAKKTKKTTCAKQIFNNYNERNKVSTQPMETKRTERSDRFVRILLHAHIAHINISHLTMFCFVFIFLSFFFFLSFVSAEISHIIQLRFSGTFVVDLFKWSYHYCEQQFQ